MRLRDFKKLMPDFDAQVDLNSNVMIVTDFGNGKIKKTFYFGVSCIDLLTPCDEDNCYEDWAAQISTMYGYASIVANKETDKFVSRTGFYALEDAMTSEGGDYQVPVSEIQDLFVINGITDEQAEIIMAYCQVERTKGLINWAEKRNFDVKALTNATVALGIDLESEVRTVLALINSEVATEIDRRKAKKECQIKKAKEAKTAVSGFVADGSSLTNPTKSSFLKAWDLGTPSVVSNDAWLYLKTVVDTISNDDWELFKKIEVTYPCTDVKLTAEIADPSFDGKISISIPKNFKGEGYGKFEFSYVKKYETSTRKETKSKIFEYTYSINSKCPSIAQEYLAKAISFYKGDISGF